MPKWLYFLLSFTWGILVSIAGLLAAGFLLIIGFRPRKFCYGWYFNIGGNSGGLNLGPISIVSTEKLLPHEFGHSVQNCMFGPFMIPCVIIPSVIRFWYRRLNKITQPPYDAIWFEGQATKLGKRYEEKLVEGTNNENT